MLISLVFHIFNKEDDIESILHSWLKTLSGSNEIEVIIVYDALRDKSRTRAERALDSYGVSACHLEVVELFEIFCNQLGFQQSHGEWVIFLQDDNWMYDRYWDRTVVDVIRRTPDIGVIGLLAGSSFQDIGSWDRLEIDREHKGEHLGRGVKDLELGVWQCDAVCRPFAISAKLLSELRGLSLVYYPQSFDDLDVSIRALQVGKRNVLIPFDLVNTVGKLKTMTEQQRKEIWLASYEQFKRRHRDYLDTRTPVPPKMLQPLQVLNGGLAMV